MSDLEFLSIQFEFEGETYFSLARKKKKMSGTEYHITVMNGELEKMLYGNHIIKEVNGKLDPGSNTGDAKLLALKQAVTKALQRYLASENSQEVATA